ncbi:UDP-N-acetylmuramate dehydrogenase [Haliovirga abyssi]|uniref:UDP-N-acetylenolpyruvoylglucosamine reductase n=1 Tax=Haliovirga abyssi TaxID=2996794 RepID=A0AAU9D8L9_9FUSO|nr:UDP-N-acetylmuramate dehydrogenase [Haliovirga abyssi]BDU49600.1 UDP-N-acetylenolpyruvoylglucosamine reductase [Haliovirga abyssi]
MQIIKNANIKKYSYIKIGGELRELIIIEKKDELKELENIFTGNNFIIIGKGSNILFSDEKIDKTAIYLKGLKKIKEVFTNIIKVESGVLASELIGYMREHNFSGIEELAGIPGTIGGMLVMNAGANGKEIFDVVKEVELFDTLNMKFINLKKEDIDFGYRYTNLLNDKIITSVKIKLEKGFKNSVVESVLKKRAEKQPLEYPNLGSVFKNPDKDYAGRLIEEVGLKGFRIGDVQIANKHANFIVNLGNGKSKDMISLIDIIKSKIKDKFNIELKEEIKKID